MPPLLMTVSALPAGFLVEVVNEWGTAPRQAAGEQDGGYPDLAALAAAHQVDLDPATTRMSDHGLTRIADALYPVFSAPADDAAVEVVNDLLNLSAPQPRLCRVGGTLVEKWAAPASQGLLVSCVLTLYQQLILWGDSRRLGLCTGARCADVYIDLSSAGRKRFCSLGCQNRNRVAAFRARRRQPGSAGVAVQGGGRTDHLGR